MAGEIQNYDEQQGVRWFRIANNPDTLMVALADEFKSWVASRLQMRPSLDTHGYNGVELIWIEPVDTLEARKIWSEYEDQETQPSWTDKIKVRYSCFYLQCRNEEFIVGCTPTYAKGHVLIQSGLSYYCTLRGIADECYHVFQDFSRGGDWRSENDDQFVEAEAAEFADSLAA
jgi:hypothetical protein